MAAGGTQHRPVHLQFNRMQKGCLVQLGERIKAHGTHIVVAWQDKGDNQLDWHGAQQDPVEQCATHPPTHTHTGLSCSDLIFLTRP